MNTNRPSTHNRLFTLKGFNLFFFLRTICHYRATQFEDVRRHSAIQKRTISNKKKKNIPKFEWNTRLVQNDFKSESDNKSLRPKKHSKQCTVRIPFNLKISLKNNAFHSI